MPIEMIQAKTAEWRKMKESVEKESIKPENKARKANKPPESSNVDGFVESVPRPNAGVYPNLAEKYRAKRAEQMSNTLREAQQEIAAEKEASLRKGSIIQRAASMVAELPGNPVLASTGLELGENDGAKGIMARKVIYRFNV